MEEIVKIFATAMPLFTVLVFVQIFSVTEGMNQNKRAPLFAIISTSVCFGIYFFDPTFLGISRVSAFFPMAFLCYFILQTIFAFVLSTSADKVEYASL